MASNILIGAAPWSECYHLEWIQGWISFVIYKFDCMKANLGIGSMACFIYIWVDVRIMRWGLAKQMSYLQRFEYVNYSNEIKVYSHPHGNPRLPGLYI